MIAYKFLGDGAVSPFTGFRWPASGTWVTAPVDRDAAWVHACRRGDLPYWLDRELWSIELDGPVRHTRYQVAGPRARLVARIAAFDEPLGREYARACALRARDLALPFLPPALRDAIDGGDLSAVAGAARDPGPSTLARYVADAMSATRLGPAMTSYVACIVAASLGGGLAGFEAERGWQARWLTDHLGLRAG